MRAAGRPAPALVTALVTALFTALAGCAPPPAGTAVGAAGPGPIPVGRSTRTLDVGGTTRTFLLYRPATLPDPAPLVVMLHGGGGSAAAAETGYGWDAEADSGHFLVAYPDGLDRSWDAGGGCCGPPARRGVDDVGFVGAVVAAIGHQVPVDGDRVYATGISAGGIMAYALACRTTLFAAIGPDSATQLGDCARPAPLSVIHIHGTADRRIPYAGGVGPEGTGQVDGPAVPALNATWRTTDRCAAPTTTAAGPVTTTTADCPDGRAVELVTIAGAGHQWPGSPPKRAPDADPPSPALDATHAIWLFFSAHPRT